MFVSNETVYLYFKGSIFYLLIPIHLIASRSNKENNRKVGCIEFMRLRSRQMVYCVSIPPLKKIFTIKLRLHSNIDFYTDQSETDVLLGDGRLLSNQEKIENLPNNEVIDEKDTNDLEDLYTDSKIDDQSRKIIECLKLSPVIMEDEDRVICFVSDTKHKSLIKNNNKRIKLSIPEVSCRPNLEDCIHIPKKANKRGYSV